MSGHSIFGGKKGLFGEPQGAVSVDLNLTPLMDVMSNILFFLLASFGAALLSYINVSYPVQSDGEPTPMKQDVVTVNLQVTPEAYKINLSNDEVPAEKRDRYRKTIPKAANGQYDDVTLNAFLYEVKQAFPGSETVILVPDQKLLYSDLIRTMDASREKKDQGKRIRLFPKVVVADLVKSDTPE